MRNNTNPFNGIDRTAHIIHLTTEKEFRDLDWVPTMCGNSKRSITGGIIYAGHSHELKYWHYNLCKDCMASDEYAMYQLANCGE
jgi:hypothetical protein